MSLENEGLRSPDKGSNKFDEVSKKPEISYSREFLLSLSNLDICKKLPSGFDESLLCEFKDGLQSVQDRPRIPGSLPMQGFRRNEFGSSPPTQGDSGNYSRGIYGKWENRSSGQSDRDSDSQSDRDSDSGRHYSHQPRQARQTEQNGLLGSGSFPRPSGFAAGISAPKVRANEHFQLSKSNELYHPPRPYKAVPYSRRDTDAFNDETFGSMECSNEDRAEEERRRRASFDLMRKEQQKAVQETQTLNKSSDISSLCEASAYKKEEKEPVVTNNECEISGATPTLDNDLEKSSFASHSSASRLLVPPGFKNNILEKSSELKYPIHHPSLKEEKPVTGESLLDAEVKFFQNGINDGLERRFSQEISLVDGQPVEKTPLLDKRENLNLHVSLDMHIRKPGMEDQLPHASSHLDSQRTLDDPEIVEHNANVLKDKPVGNPHKKISSSILGEIFGSTLSLNNDGSGSAEHYHGKPDDARSTNSVQLSKFAHWFNNEEAKPADDISRGKPSDLLSLIASGDKVKHQVSESEAAAQQFPHDLFSNTLEQSKRPTLEIPSAADEACVDNKEGTIPSVLTCKDLEQSILTEYSAKTANAQPLLKGWSTSDANTAQSKSEHIDDHASLHLLSLLHKGTDNVPLNSSSDINSTDKPLLSRQHNVGPTPVNEPKVKQNGKNIPVSGETLTLETLFGSAFMKELQSVGAPVSVHRGSTGPTEVGQDNDISSSAIDETGLQRLISAEFQLPGENLISVTDPRNHGMLKFIPPRNSTENVNFSLTAPIDIMAQQVRPLYNNHLESDLAHMSPQMKFLRQEPMINCDSPANHQFPSNMIHRPFHHPNVGNPRLDVPSHHPMLRQKQMSSNHAPHLLPDFPSGGPVAHHGNQAGGFIQEMDQMHGFPVGPRQTNVGNRPAPGINSGGPPEAFQRLVEMELRANTNRIHPVHKVDMDLRSG